MRHPVAFSALCAGALLGSCSSSTTTPSPSRPRVLLEIDRMQGRPAIPDTNRITAIFARAGIDVEVREDQDDLPAAASVDLADLHSLMTTHRSVDAELGVWKLHMLIVSTEAGRPRTLGIMFDFGTNDANDIPREAFAVFADAHAESTRAEEMLLTAAHELAHCFNIHHTDWEGTSFDADGTVESYSMADTVRWELSGRSMDHLRSTPQSMYMPGAGGVTFGYISQQHADRHQTTPHESYVIVDPSARERAPRGRAVEAAAAERGAERRASPETWSLALTAPKQRYVVGEPVWVDLKLTNQAREEKRLYLDLDPRGGMTTVLLRRPGASVASLFVPPVHACARRSPDVLPAGASVQETFQVFFDANGWAITKPGTYTIEASFPVGAPGREPIERAHAEPLVIEVEAPPEAAAARAKILAHEVGLYLMLEGASHLHRADQQLVELYAEAPLATDQKAAIGLALAKARFDPSLPGAAELRRETPNQDAAAGYLAPAGTAEVNLDQAVRMQRAFVESFGARASAGKEAAQQDLNRLQEKARRAGR